MKKRIRQGDPRKQAYWEAVVRRWREGGGSVRAFCRAEGLRESAFYFWRRELDRRDRRQDAVPRAGNHAAKIVGSRAIKTAGNHEAKTVGSRATHAAEGSSAIFVESRATQVAAGGRAAAARASRPTFLPLGVAELAAAKVAAGVEIILGDGRAVRVSAGFDRRTLLDVLAALEEARPC